MRYLYAKKFPDSSMRLALLLICFDMKDFNIWVKKILDGLSYNITIKMF